MKTFKTVNDLMGWLIFAVAAYTYCSTIEPTASFWDCPEFITTAAKLEVGHPPGAPFFMLFGNLFASFASDPSEIARMVNTMSALLSAGCILFLFWSITHLARKLLCQDNEEISAAKLITIMGCGIAGSLIYTWSDTFWFSAVEGEVYAFSSFMTALVFWLILKWENNADKSGSDRWLVLIAYLMGLSIGVHLLNLLCIPAIVLVFYYKKCKNPTAKGSLAVLAVSAVIVVAVLYGVVPGIVKIGGWFELLFVNALGMSFNTGLYIYLVLLVASLVWALYESTQMRSKTRINVSFLVAMSMLGIPFYGHGVGCVIIGIIAIGVVAFILFNNKKVSPRILNTVLLCMTLMTVGYSSYALIVIRSTANPPMDQNSPEDVFSLGDYLGREQYGDRPLFMGPTYASKPNVVRVGDNLMYEQKVTASVYQRKDKEQEGEKDKYIKVYDKKEFVYPMNQQMLFPRIWSDDNSRGYPAAYQQWLGNGPSKTVSYQIPGGETQQVTLPTQWDNLRFFFSYQLNFMYWRYFMWNFAGRQNDIQGHGELEHGNWITGISAFDNMRLGDQSKLPSDLRENKGHNVFYCLPLLLGLLGFFWQAFRDKKGIQQFWVVFFLFFMTGIAIVLYLNQTPIEPRERDYAYAGSFYAFAMWCGLGIAAIYEALERLLGKNFDKRMAATLASVLSLVPAVAIPLQMVSQTWDDHDRSGRYVCRDFGLNYLETIPHDGVIYTNGDNDTFPLWYNEDTEGNRTDVRVCNLSYLQTDWYIDQMKRPAYEGEGQSSPLPIHWTRLQYTTGKNEATEVNPEIGIGGGSMTMKDFVLEIYKQDSVTAHQIWGDNPFELKTVIDKFVLKQGIPAKYAELVANLPSCIPTDTVYVTVDKEAVRRSGMMIPNDSIPDVMEISLKGRSHVYKSFMMMLEMIAQSNFSRPLYMSTTVGSSNYGSLYRHFIQEGIAYRISPFTFEGNRPMMTVVDTEKMYDNMMNKYRYGNLKQKGLYIDETTMRMCYTHRRWFAVLITNLVQEGKLDMARKALAKCAEEIPSYNVPHDTGSGSIEIANAYIACGQPEKAVEILEHLEKIAHEYIDWYLSLNPVRFAAATEDCFDEIRIIANLQKTYETLSMSEKAGKNTSKYTKKMEDMDVLLNSLYDAFIRRCEAEGINFN